MIYANLWQLLSQTSKISASEYQNFLIIDDFMEAAINRILTSRQIPETLPGPALWRYVGSQKWCFTQYWGG